MNNIELQARLCNKKARMNQVAEQCLETSKD